MANLSENFTQIFLTYKDVKEANPNWSDRMIEDYLSLKRDLETTADTTDAVEEIEVEEAPLMRALINDLKAQIGSGNALTSDETGFTVDSTRLTVDRTEA